MKTKKINLNWQSFLLGIVLCTLVVVFLGSKPYDPQVGDAEKTVKSLTITDLLTKSTEMQKEILAMNKDLVRIEKKIDGLAEELHQVLKIVRVVERELEKGK